MKEIPRIKHFSSHLTLFRRISHYSTAQTSDAVFVLGGYYTANVAAEYKNDQWRKLDDLQQPRRGHRSVVIENQLISIGGKDETSTDNL